MDPRIGFQLLLALAAAAPALAQDLPALYDVQDVAGDEVLNLRAAPDPGAEALGNLAPDARDVEVVALSPDGAWGLIGHGESGGWVAMRYLVLRPDQTPWWQLQTQLLCLGTEPHWTLDLAPGGARAIFTTPEPPALSLHADLVWPGQDWLREAGVTLSGDGATAALLVRGGECSDGMSDRTYGLAATLLLTGAPIGDGTPLTGCCIRSVP